MNNSGKFKCKKNIQKVLRDHTLPMLQDHMLLMLHMLPHTPLPLMLHLMDHTIQAERTSPELALVTDSAVTLSSMTVVPTTLFTVPLQLLLPLVNFQWFCNAIYKQPLHVILKYLIPKVI